MTTVVQAYRFALDLTPMQECAAFSHIGGSRFAYNVLLYAVGANINQREAERSYGISEDDLTPSLNWSAYGLRKLFNVIKHQVAPWWKENSKETYADAARRLAAALANWRASKKGTRKGARVGFPRWDRKDGTGSVRFTTGAIRVEPDRHHITLPTLGKLKTHESTRKLARRLEAGTARLLSATLTLRGGKWFVSFTVEVDRNIPAARPANRTVGVDAGVKSLYTGATPSGEHVLNTPNPKHFHKAEQRIVRASRKLSRKQGPDPDTGEQPSNRWKKQRRHLRRVHRTVANQRQDLIHKTTTALAQQFDVIVIEDLNIEGMKRNKHLAKAISDAGWGEFRRQLAYKTSWYGSTLVVADRWFPSSKTCAACGAVKTKLSLAQRTYECSECGTVTDRDLNAATNLARYPQVVGTPGSGSGAGRGGLQKTPRSNIRSAAADETSTSLSFTA